MRWILLAFFLLFSKINNAQLIRFEKYVDGNNKFGFKNSLGQIIVPAKYDKVMPCLNKKNYWAVNIGAYYIVNKDKSAGPLIGGKWGFIDSTGKEVIPIIYDHIGINTFTEGLAAVALNERWGYLNENGETVIPFKYEYAYSFDEEYAIIELNKKVGIIDNKGKIIIPINYEEIDFKGFSEGLLAVKLNGKWGYINNKNEVIVKFKYDYAYAFSEGKALINKGGKEKIYGGCSGGKFGYIDKSGKEIIKIIFDDASSFHEGTATVTKDLKHYIIDNTGKEIIIPQKKEDDSNIEDE